MLLGGVCLRLRDNNQGKNIQYRGRNKPKGIKVRKSLACLRNSCPCRGLSEEMEKECRDGGVLKDQSPVPGGGA